MSTSAFVESGVASALKSLDRAFEQEAARDRELGRHLLLAFEQLRAVQDLIEVERGLEMARASAERDAARLYPTPLRVVK